LIRLQTVNLYLSICETGVTSAAVPVRNQPTKFVISSGLIFLSGIINDVILNFPIGLSSISYLILCVMASLLRNRTLIPNLLYDWTFFFLSILIVNSSNYILQTLIFSSDISYESLMSNTICTSLVYPIFAKIFNKINIYNLREENA